MSRARRWAAAARDLDRRWLYLMLLAAVVWPLLAGLRFHDRPSSIVRAVFDRVEKLPPGRPLLLSLDYSPSSAPELEPMAEALTRHALLSGHPVCYLSLWPAGNNMIDRVVDRVIRKEFPAARPGREYVVLGFQEGGQMLINSLRDSLAARYRTDVDGRPLAGLPALRGVRGVGDFGLVISLSAGVPGLKEWILYAGDVVGVPVAGGCTGVGAPQFFPYDPQQLVGLLAALKGASEYEAALHQRYPRRVPADQRAGLGMGPQTVAHLLLVALILLGNAAWWLAGGRRP